MRLNSLPFTEKLLRLKPKIVCFVGKKIWDVYESVIRKTATAPIIATRQCSPGASTSWDDTSITNTPNGIVKVEPNTNPTSPITPIKIEIASTSSLQDPPNEVGGSMSRRGREKVEKPKFDWTQPRPFRLPHFENGQVEGYTYFWVVPNTSGLERTPVSPSSAPPYSSRTKLDCLAPN